MRVSCFITLCAGITLLGMAIVLVYRGSLALLTEAIYEIDVTHRPYMVSIERQGLHHCAGVVVSRSFVLTSAHCFRRVTNYSVRAGSDMVQQGGSQHAIQQIILHPKYSPFQVAFDIALVEVKPHFTQSRNIYPVRLAEFGDPEPADYMAELTGWGHTRNPAERSRTLRRVDVHIIHSDVCSALDPEYTTATPLIMCGSFRGNKNKDPYVGDPGAPLMVRGAAVGVASWRLLMVQGSAPGPYAFFVAVQALRPWIDKHARFEAHFATTNASAATATDAAAAAAATGRKQHAKEANL